MTFSEGDLPPASPLPPITAGTGEPCPEPGRPDLPYDDRLALTLFLILLLLVLIF